MKGIFFTVLPIFSIIILGAVLRRQWFKSEEFWRGLERLTYYVLFPSVLFSYISQADLGSGKLTQLIWVLIIATLIISAGLVYYQEKFGTDKCVFTSIFQGAIRYNSYIFIGLADALYGNEGLGIVAVVSAYMIIFTNVVSVLIFNAYVEDKVNSNNSLDNVIKVLKKMLSNPLILSSLAGFAVNYAGIELNIGVKKFLASLSEAAMSMSILCIGANLKFKVSKADTFPVLYASAIKLLIMPVVVFILLRLLGIGGLPKAVGILYACLPASSSSYVLSRQMGGDYESMASIITITTMLSIISLTILLSILT